RAGFTDMLLKPIAPLELLMAVVRARDAIHRAQQLTRSAREIVARGKIRGEASRQGVATFERAIASSRQSLSRPLRGCDDLPASAEALLETLIGGDYLDADHHAVACKVLSVGEPSLLAWESPLYALVKQQFLQPACKLCRYRIPAAEVTASWQNGGYCSLCLDSIT
ncbi:MAG TPA: hypothetical protein VHC19_03795, partial [Pirellulales bacterium]|nr:hypothetical protein [Pirellulales bacterium]